MIRRVTQGATTLRIARWCRCAALIALSAASPFGHAATDLDAVLARWDGDERPGLRGVVVLRDGDRVAERYFHDATADERNDVRSAGKSVTALLVGIAIDRGAIRSIDDPVAKYWPAAEGTAVGAVPLRDVLTMRAGLHAFDDDPASPGNEDRLDAADDPLALALAVPKAEPSGKRYVYNSHAAYVTGVVVAEATRTDLGEWAGKQLFAPIGVTDWRWQKDASGKTKGQGNLWLTTRGFAAIGELVRRRGLVDGRRVVDAGWIDAMLAPTVAIADEDPYADGYGYFWYRKDHRIGDATIGVSFASGNGGNKIYVVSACRLVVAITSNAYGQGYGQRRSEEILKAVLAAEAQAGRCTSDAR